MTPEQIRKAWDRDPQTVANTFREILNEFGYPITTEYVRTEIERLMTGEKPTGGPSMFLAGWLGNGT